MPEYLVHLKRTTVTDDTDVILADDKDDAWDKPIEEFEERYDDGEEVAACTVTDVEEN